MVKKTPIRIFCGKNGFQGRFDSWLPGFLLKNNLRGFKKEAMNPGSGVVKSKWRMTNPRRPTTNYQRPNASNLGTWNLILGTFNFRLGGRT
jgi:hypothetical protein